MSTKTGTLPHLKNRYYGDESGTGIVTVASILNMEQEKLHIGWSLHRNDIMSSIKHEGKVYTRFDNVKYDKTFSRTIAAYRLLSGTGHMDDSVRAEIDEAFAKCRSRVRKQHTRVRISHEEYLERRKSGRNAGYYSTNTEFFVKEDFNVENFFCTIDLSDALETDEDFEISHKNLDLLVMAAIMEHPRTPRWAKEMLLELTEMDGIEDDDDDEHFDGEDEDLDDEDNKDESNDEDDEE